MSPHAQSTFLGSERLEWKNIVYFSFWFMMVADRSEAETLTLLFYVLKHFQSAARQV